MERITIEQLETELKGKTLEGYIWMSDKTAPSAIYNGEPFCGLPIAEKNFIIEGQLYETEGKNSYSLSYLDGEVLVQKHEYADRPAENDITQQEFIASFDGAPGKLKFEQYWRERPDELCDNMPVLEMAERVFAGYVKQ